jgi:hypothetical protein
METGLKNKMIIKCNAQLGIVVCFYNNIHFKCWYVRWSYCLLPFDLPPQDACLQDMGDSNDL